MYVFRNMNTLQIICNYPEANNKGSKKAENAKCPSITWYRKANHQSTNEKSHQRTGSHCVVPSTIEPGLGPFRIPPASSNTKHNSQEYV
jgi:hypothetical protein